MTNLNNKVMDQNPEQMKLKYVANELAGLRQVLTHLYDGQQGAFNALIFIKGNYKQWPEIFQWLKANKLYGKKLVEFFQNESPDGGGYHLGVTLILARINGQKHSENIIKIDQLIGG